jgi:hypothetical protein
MDSRRLLNAQKIKTIEDQIKTSKANQLAVLTKVKEVIDTPDLTNKEKIQLYGCIKKLRSVCNLKPGDYDALGFNLLHWATKSGRVDDVNELVSQYEGSNGDSQQGADMDAQTSKSWDLISNMTPLWIAAKHGYSNIVLLLLKNQANLLIGAEDWRTKSTPLVEAYNQKHDDIVKLLEQPTLDAYTKHRKQHHNEYKTTTSIFGLFTKKWGYSKTDKLIAAQALQEQLASKECDPVALETLKKIHPAVNEGELGSIYKASVGIRKKL